MRLFLWCVLGLSVPACGSELGGRGDTADTQDTHELEVDTAETRDAELDVDTGPEDTGPDGDLVEDVDLDSEPDGNLTDLADTDLDSDSGPEDTGLEDTDLVDSAPDTGLEDAGPDDTGTPDTNLVDTAPDIGLEDTAPGDITMDAGPDDTVEETYEIDTVDNPCGFPPAILNDRYGPMSGLSGSELRAALSTFVTIGAVGFEYDEARDLMYGITGSVDITADNHIECVYTGFLAVPDGTRSPGSGPTEITTEHSWPRSDGAGSFPAEGDMHHLFPALGPANNSRGSYEFGDVACGLGFPRSCEWADGGSFLGAAVDGRSHVFEVREQARGDIARAHFYFAVRYGRPIPPDEEVTLRRWHCEDPPSSEERARNSRIEVHQHNRNPFIDQPRWVERVVDF